MQQIDDYIRNAQHLPPAPLILLQLVPLLGRPDTDSTKIIELITYDQSLTAGVIRMSNSAFYGAGERISSLNDAVMRLGFVEIYRLVAAVFGARTLTRGPKINGIDPNELWKNSVTTAVAAQVIARDFGVDEQAAFTVGLLNDIGVIVFSEALRGQYADLIQEIEINCWPLLETERKRLGMDHAEVGARLLQRWGFPAAFVVALRNHHRPANAHPHEKLAACVFLGNLIASFMGHTYGCMPRGRDQALAVLGLTPQALPGYMSKTFDQYGAIETLVFSRNDTIAPAPTVSTEQ